MIAIILINLFALDVLVFLVLHGLKKKVDELKKNPILGSILGSEKNDNNL